MRTRKIWGSVEHVTQSRSRVRRSPDQRSGLSLKTIWISERRRRDDGDDDKGRNRIKKQQEWLQFRSSPHMNLPPDLANPIPSFTPPCLSLFLPAYCTKGASAKGNLASDERRETHHEGINQACDGQNSTDDGASRGEEVSKGLALLPMDDHER